MTPKFDTVELNSASESLVKMNGARMNSGKNGDGVFTMKILWRRYCQVFNFRKIVLHSRRSSVVRMRNPHEFIIPKMMSTLPFGS